MPSGRAPIGVRRREGARAPAATASLGDAAEGDRAARGRDRPVRALGVLGAERATHRASEESSARLTRWTRSSGRVRAPEDGARASTRRARRPADCRCATSRWRSMRTRSSSTSRSTSTGASGSDRRTERRREDRARSDPRRRARCHVGGPMDRAVGPDRVPGAGLQGSGPSLTPVETVRKTKAMYEARRSRCWRSSCSATTRCGRRSVAVRRRADAARALPPDAVGRELPDARRTDEPSRHREHGGARGRRSRSTGPRS